MNEKATEVVDNVTYFRGVRYGSCDQRFGPCYLKSLDDGSFLNDTRAFPQSVYNSKIWSTKEIYHTEDAFTMDIWVPNEAWESQSLLPIIFWIYGGGFQEGSNYLEIYNCLRLASRARCLIVAPNYRVSLFGFLHLPEFSINGNMGLEDQVIALEWIKTNIEKFHGNPDNITLMGNSAGSASISWHVQHSQTLINNAFMISGHLDCRWACESGGKSKEKSEKLLNSMQGENREEKFKQLLSLPCKLLLDCSNEIMDNTRNPLAFAWLPWTSSGILDYQQLSPHIKIFFGFFPYEILYFIPIFCQDNYENYVERFLGSPPFSVDEKEVKSTHAMYKDQDYFSCFTDKTSSMIMPRREHEEISLLSDITFNIPLLRSMKNISDSTENLVHGIVFDMKPVHWMRKKDDVPITESDSASVKSYKNGLLGTHADDVPYLFQLDLNCQESRVADKLASLVEAITWNKTGDHWIRFHASTQFNLIKLDSSGQISQISAGKFVKRILSQDNSFKC